MSQGCNGGLAALAAHFGVEVADDASAPAAPAPPAPAAAATASTINLEKRIAEVQSRAPDMVSLVKSVGLTLEKKGVSIPKAKVALVLDISGSMSGLFRSAPVDALAQRALALGLTFDDDGEIDTHRGRLDGLPARTSQTTQGFRPMLSSPIKKLFAAKVVLVLLLHVVVFSYALPRVSVVQVVATEIKRVDTQNPDASVATQDVYQIQTNRIEDGKPRVFHNEDNWIYLKFDSADLQTLAATAERKDAAVAITSYGWRVPFLSMFPNAISLKEVDPDYRHIPFFNIVFLTAWFGALAFLWFRINTAMANTRRRLEERRLAREAEEREVAERRALEAELARDAEAAKNKDLDDFLNS